MANQIIVSQDHTVQISIEPTPQVQVQYSRAAINAVTEVEHANTANFATVAGTALHANVADVANNVSVSNVAGIGNIATVNLNGNVSTVLKGDGTWGEAAGNNANYANYANFAGTAFSVSGGNVVGEVANAAYAGISASAYNIAGSNVSGPVANATFATTSGTAQSVAGANVSGQVAYAQVANSVAAANVVGTVANASYATNSGHATVADSANSVAGANVSGYVANATHATVADSANSVAGSNVSGQVANALVAGTVYTNNQPNITSVGTLSSLSVSGTSNIGATNIAGNLTATGNITAAYFLGNVVGNISGNLVVPGTNTSVLYNDSGNAGASSNFTFDEVTNVVTLLGNINATYFIGDGSQLTNIDGSNISNVGNANHANIADVANSVAGSNVSGYVANANHANIADVANSVAGGNVSGAVAYASIANSVAGANVSGTVANATYATNAGTAYSVSAANVSGTVANANYATYAGTAYSVSGSNISGEVANANYATFAGTAYSVSGSNVTSQVANANFATYSDVANSANSVAGANVSGEVANAGYSTYSGTAYSVSGSNVSGEVANAAYATTAGTAYNVSGSNVSGDVSGSNHANIADVANSVSVSNVAGIGNIATVNLDGNVSSVLLGDGSWGAAPSGDANYANFAGQVVDATQSNITQTGNLLLVNVNNSAANTRSPTFQFIPTGINVSNAGSPLSSMVYTDYGSQGSNSAAMNWSFVKARGNVDAPLTAGNSDQILRLSSHVYNSNTSPRAVIISTTAPLAGNSTFQAANVAWTPGSFNVVTGNPNGNITSNTASSAQNILNLNQVGALSITPGTYGTNSGTITVVNYGANSDSTGGSGATLNLQRNRGNRDSNTAAQPDDNLGSVSFNAYTGSLGSRTGASIQASVDANATITNGVAPNTNMNISTTNGYVSIDNGSGILNVGDINVTNVNAFNLFGDGGNISNISASSIVGTVANASYADNAGNASNATYATTAGTADGVAGANVFGEVANAAYATIAGTAYSVDVANVSGIGNIATVNLDGSSSNVLYGNGTWAPASGGGGNTFSTLDITDGNVNHPTVQFSSAGIVTGPTANLQRQPNSFQVVTDYGNGQGDGNLVMTKSLSYNRARGSSATPTTVVSGDRLQRTTFNAYNGANYTTAGFMNWQVANVNANANAVWSAGQFNIVTGNPNGDWGNANSSSPQNLMLFAASGNLTLLPGTYGTNGGALQQTNFGANSDGSSGTGAQHNMLRARGSRDGSTAIVAGDTLGTISFQGYTGSSGYRSGATIQAISNSSGTITNGGSIATDLNINATGGNVLIGNGGGNLVANYYYGNGSMLSGIATIAGSDTEIQYNNSGAAGASSAFTYNYGSNILGLRGSINQVLDSAGGAIAFNTYTDGNVINSFSVYRASGTPEAPGPVTVPQTVYAIRMTGYGDSTHTNVGIGGYRVFVDSNSGTQIIPRTQYYEETPGAGGIFQIQYTDIRLEGEASVTGNLSMSTGGNISGANVITANSFSGNGAGLTGITVDTANSATYATNVTGSSQGNITSVGTLTGLTVSGTANISNLQLNQFQETEYAIGSVSGTITPDFVNGSIQTMTLTGNITMNSLANIAAGKSMTLVLTQGGTGSYTLTSSMKFAGGAKTLSTSVGAVDIISIFYTGSTYYATLSTGYA